MAIKKISKNTFDKLIPLVYCSADDEEYWSDDESRIIGMLAYYTTKSNWVWFIERRDKQHKLLAIDIESGTGPKEEARKELLARMKKAEVSKQSFDSSHGFWGITEDWQERFIPRFVPEEEGMENPKPFPLPEDPSKDDKELDSSNDEKFRQ